MSFFNDVKLLDPNKEIVVATEGVLPSLDGSRLTNLSVTGGAVTILKTYTSPLSSISFPSDSGVVSASYSEMSLSIIIDSSLAAPFKTYLVKDGVMREAVMGTGYYNLDGVDVYEIGADEIEGEQIVLQLLSAGGAVESVNGKTGTVVLSKSDLGLGNVNNTSDADKPISTATQAALDAALDSIPAEGVDGGFAPLSGGKIPSQYLNATASTHVVATIAARDGLTPILAGERAFVTDASGDSTVTSGAAEYIWDGSAWVKIAEEESLDLILDWGNLQNKPNTFPPESHEHAIADVSGLQTTLDGKAGTDALEPYALKSDIPDVSNFVIKSELDGLVSSDDLTDILNPSMTGSITLNGTTDNTVEITDIVTELDLEIGDVIRIDAGAYNKLHTVESITDNSSIIVNYEHAGNMGDGSLKLPEFTGQATATRVAKWFNAPLGIGQAWVDLTGSRVTDTTYTNTTGRPIAISVNILQGKGEGMGELRVGGALVVKNLYPSTVMHEPDSLFAIVPPGDTYVWSGDQALHCWAELR